MIRVCKCPELQRLAGLVVVEKLFAVFQVSKEQVANVIGKRGGPVQERLHTVGSAGYGTDTDELDATLPQVRKGKFKEPLENLMACAGLQICHNDALFLRDRFFDQDIVGKLWPDTYLDGFWKEPRHSVILVVEVQDQWRGPFLLKVSDQEPCSRGLAGATFRSGCENESVGHGLSSL